MTIKDDCKILETWKLIFLHACLEKSQSREITFDLTVSIVHQTIDYTIISEDFVYINI